MSHSAKLLPFPHHDSRTVPSQTGHSQVKPLRTVPGPRAITMSARTFLPLHHSPRSYLSQRDLDRLPLLPPNIIYTSVVPALPQCHLPRHRPPRRPHYRHLPRPFLGGLGQEVAYRMVRLEAVEMALKKCLARDGGPSQPTAGGMWVK